MYFRIILYTICLGLSSFLYAQKMDIPSQKILSILEKNYLSGSPALFKFSFYAAKKDDNKKELGTLYTSGNKYRLKIKDMEQIFDGKKIYNISSEDKEITIAKSDENEMVVSPLSYLDLYKKNYTARYIGKKKLNGKILDHILLRPIQPNETKEISLYIADKKLLERIEEISKDGSIRTTEIINYQPKVKFPPNFFSFQKNNYKGYLITEL
ncbi:MAG: outer membrane lipoprotein carrier protein LolA [Bergeyella sp.]|nr:outer membrane lipoprotein carrier protein LolA [Bergeyella sp.]